MYNNYIMNSSVTKGKKPIDNIQSVVKVLKHPSVSSGPFNQSDTIQFNLPPNLDVVDARLEYGLTITSDVGQMVCLVIR